MTALGPPHAPNLVQTNEPLLSSAWPSPSQPQKKPKVVVASAQDVQELLEKRSKQPNSAATIPPFAILRSSGQDLTSETFQDQAEATANDAIDDLIESKRFRWAEEVVTVFFFWICAPATSFVRPTLSHPSTLGSVP